MTMANSSRSRSRGPNLQRSLSPSAGRFCSSSISSTSAFYSSSSDFFKRSSSPTRVNLYRGVSSSPSPSVRFSIERQTSPRRSISVSPRDQVYAQEREHRRQVRLRRRVPVESVECSEIGDDELAGEDWGSGRGLGEESVVGVDSAVVTSTAAESGV
ncbi:hypothetical protein CK203_054683 [Vitis vinifera]|uniref:Uncharacterized protein n=1 Tax=Vitis vinifera TaxID=29760 RepID=A0A438H9C3_VITVI|nr:hypothetical protein CK203_054683 [Vitis vinifera]